MKFRGMIILAGLLLLTGCATLSKEECLKGDWRGLGMKDGVNGEPAVQIEQHRKACAEYSIRPDEKIYMDGRAEGLREYCQIDNAFRSGLSGRQYKGVCPPAINLTFFRYNEAAYRVYQTREEIKKLHNEIASKQREMENNKTTDKERIHLRGEIREREKRLDELRNYLRDRERDLDDMIAEARYGKRR
jgi:hypothetical protein